MVNTPTECLEIIAQIFENAEKVLYDLLAEVPTESQARIEEVIVNSLRARIEEYDANKKKEKDSSIIKILN
jgi:cob(I)alamin adenosyltransferase